MPGRGQCARRGRCQSSVNPTAARARRAGSRDPVGGCRRPASPALHCSQPHHRRPRRSPSLLALDEKSEPAQVGRLVTPVQGVALLVWSERDMRASEFDEVGFFRAICDSGARALLIGRRALVLLGLPVLTADYEFWLHIDDVEPFNRALEPSGLWPLPRPGAGAAEGTLRARERRALRDAVAGALVPATLSDATRAPRLRASCVRPLAAHSRPGPESGRLLPGRWARLRLPRRRRFEPALRARAPLPRAPRATGRTGS